MYAFPYRALGVRTIAIKIELPFLGWIVMVRRRSTSAPPRAPLHRARAHDHMICFWRRRAFVVFSSSEFEVDALLLIAVAMSDIDLIGEEDVPDLSSPRYIDLDGVQGGDSAAFVESISETDSDSSDSGPPTMNIRNFFSRKGRTCDPSASGNRINQQRRVESVGTTSKKRKHHALQCVGLTPNRQSSTLHASYDHSKRHVNQENVTSMTVKRAILLHQ